MVKMKKIIHLGKGFIFIIVSIIFCFIKFYGLRWQPNVPSGETFISTSIRNGEHWYLVFIEQNLNWFLFALFAVLGVLEILMAFTKDKIQKIPLKR